MKINFSEYSGVVLSGVIRCCSVNTFDNFVPTRSSLGEKKCTNIGPDVLKFHLCLQMQVQSLDVNGNRASYRMKRNTS